MVNQRLRSMKPKLREWLEFYKASLEMLPRDHFWRILPSSLAEKKLREALDEEIEEETIPIMEYDSGPEPELPEGTLHVTFSPKPILDWNGIPRDAKIIGVPEIDQKCSICGMYGHES